MNAFTFVEVTDEPYHKELFQNQYIRVYNVDIKPGQETLYHRHAKDTLYIVVEGGLLSTYVVGKQKMNSVDFPKSFSIFKKICFGLNNYFFNTVRLDKSLFLFQHHSDNPIIHKVAASTKNVNNILLIGIEILEKQNHHSLLSFEHQYYKREYESNMVSIFRLKLKPGQSTGTHTCIFPGMTIIVNGSLNIKRYKYSLEDQKFKSGNYLWHDCSENRNIINNGTEELEAIFIAISRRVNSC